MGLNRAAVHFRTAPHRLRFWLRRIDRWIEYANSVVGVFASTTLKAFPEAEYRRLIKGSH